MRTAAPGERSPLAVLFLTVFVDLMGFGIVIPLLPIYAERFHAPSFPGVTGGALIASYSLMQLVFAQLWGRVSDRVGRRPVLLVSLAASAISYLLLAGAWSLGMLFVARLLAGAAGANISVAQAYIADVTSKEDRVRGMGLIGAAFGLGMVIGPALGGGLSLLGPRVPEFFAAGLCFVNFLMAAYRLPESLPASRRQRTTFRHPLAPSALREALGRPGAAVLMSVFFLTTLGFAILEGTLSLAAERRFAFSRAQVGQMWAYMGLVAVVIQGWAVGRLARRVPERSLVAAGAATLAVGFAWIPFTAGPVALLAALALVVVGHGLTGPSLSSLISKTVEEPVQHGIALGLAQSLSAGARAIGPAGGGLAFDALGVGAPFLAASLCALGALGLVGQGLRDQPAAADEAVRLKRSG